MATKQLEALIKTGLIGSMNLKMDFITGTEHNSNVDKPREQIDLA